MAANILDGIKIGNRVKLAIRRDLRYIRTRQKRILQLAVLQIGRDRSSEVYLGAQQKLANELGIKYYVKALGANVSQKNAEREIAALSNNRSVTGIMIHTPVPRHINSARLLARISAGKDVECRKPENIGKLVHGAGAIAPCTASACMALSLELSIGIITFSSPYV